MTISIGAIYYTPIASQPMIFLEKATLIKGCGLEGDRYAQRMGSFSFLRASIHQPGEQEPGRQLTLISRQGVEAAFQASGIEWNKSIGDLRRNVVVEGVTAEELLQWIGSIVQIGDSGVKLLVHRNCVPCMYNERKNQTPGLMDALWDAGGVSCEILEGGQISIGDVISIHSNTEGHLIDAGHRSKGFFTRPSKRTAGMVREELEEKKTIYQEFSVIDPKGVERIQASYESVGLSFWPKSYYNSS